MKWLRKMADFNLLRELDKNKNDKVALEAQLEIFKKTFANEIKNNGVGKEMTECIKHCSNPVKIKKPFSLRLKEKMNLFKNKLNTVLGLDGN